jgi:hypothetical protein
MKFYRAMGCFLALFLTCQVMAEPQRVFLGQADGEDAFIISFVGQNLEKLVHVTEEGEIWIRAETLVELDLGELGGSCESPSCCPSR